MSIEKENFLRTRLVSYLQQLDPSSPSQWGKMNVQQMIEHLACDALPNANGRLKFDNIMTAPDHLIKMREFLMSEKPFKENTNNPSMCKKPSPLRYKTVQPAIGKLQQELITFFEVVGFTLILITPG